MEKTIFLSVKQTDVEWFRKNWEQKNQKFSKHEKFIFLFIQSGLSSNADLCFPNNNE